MQTIPLAPVPSQTLACVLAKQNASLSLYTRGALLYLDLSVGGVPVVSTRICRNITRLLLDAQYRGFTGDLCFVDTQGDTDPVYTGLGSRYQLVYLEAADL
jgi:hypothetical protein